MGKEHSDGKVGGWVGDFLYLDFLQPRNAEEGGRLQVVHIVLGWHRLPGPELAREGGQQDTGIFLAQVVEVQGLEDGFVGGWVGGWEG